MEQLIKPKVLAEKWGVSVRTLRRMEEDGRLTPVRIGSRKRYRLSEIEALVAPSPDDEEQDETEGD